MNIRIDDTKSNIVFSENDHKILRNIELMNEKIYDTTLLPETFVRVVSDIIVSDIRSSTSYDILTEHSAIMGHLTDLMPVDDMISRAASLRFSSVKPFPWTLDDVTDVHIRLTHGRRGYNPGRMRGGMHTSVVDDTTVVDEDRPLHPGPLMYEAVRQLNESPYPALVSSAIFYNHMEMIDPFDGDNRQTHRELLKMSLYRRGFRGIRLCRLDEFFEEHDDELRISREMFLDSGDPNDMIRTTLWCIGSAYEEAMERIRPLDVKSTVDGLSRSIIRNSRRRESFALADAHAWLADIGDQTFRSRINGLIEMGLIEKTGKTKGLRYRYVDPFEKIRTENGGTFPHQDEDPLQLFYLGVGPIARP